MLFGQREGVSTARHLEQMQKRLVTIVDNVCRQARQMVGRLFSDRRLELGLKLGPKLKLELVRD